MHTSERQRRSDEATANAVARAMNILPDHVIARVLDHPELRRRGSAAQSISEAITPSARDGE